MGGCQKCEECGAEPNVIDENCDTCISCYRNNGKLRWDNSRGKIPDREQTATIKQELKPMVVVI